MDGGAPQLRPFRFNTRQRVKKVGTVTFVNGDGASLELPKIGLLSRLWIVLELDATFSSAGTYGNYGVWAAIKRVKLQLNNAAQDLVDVSGFGLFLMNNLQRKVNKFDETAGLDSALYAAPTTTGAMKIALEVPVNQSNGFNFEAGMINLQAPEVQMTLNLTFASANSDIASNITALSGTAHVYYEYYEVPDPTAVMIPPVILHKVIEQQQSFSATGEVVYTVPRAGKISRLIQILNVDALRSDAYDSVKLKLQQSDTVYDREKRLVKFQHRENYGVAAQTGVIVTDMSQAYGICEESDGRDFFDSERTTTMESIVTVTSGTTLGSSNNTLVTIREFIQVPTN